MELLTLLKLKHSLILLTVLLSGCTHMTAIQLSEKCSTVLMRDTEIYLQGCKTQSESLKDKSKPLTLPTLPKAVNEPLTAPQSIIGDY